jgi:predicted nucleic acid-binding protein
MRGESEPGSGLLHPFGKVFLDEWTPKVLRIFDEEVLLGDWVPGLWKIELANVLTLSVRRGRVTGTRRDEAFDDLNLLPIAADPETGEKVWRETITLADRLRLTVYDAA